MLNEEEQYCVFFQLEHDNLCNVTCLTNLQGVSKYFGYCKTWHCLRKLKKMFSELLPSAPVGMVLRSAIECRFLLWASHSNQTLALLTGKGQKALAHFSEMTQGLSCLRVSSPWSKYDSRSRFMLLNHCKPRKAPLPVLYKFFFSFLDHRL